MKKFNAHRISIVALVITTLLAASSTSVLAGDLAPLKNMPAVRVTAVVSHFAEEFFTGPIELQLRLRGVPVTRDKAEGFPILKFRLLTDQIPEPDRVKGTFFVGELSLIDKVALRRGGLALTATVWQSHVWLGVRPELDTGIRKIAIDLADQFAIDYLVANSPAK